MRGRVYHRQRCRKRVRLQRGLPWGGQMEVCESRRGKVAEGAVQRCVPGGMHSTWTRARCSEDGALDDGARYLDDVRPRARS